jgi:outer membrane lipoprotein SlyB
MIRSIQICLSLIGVGVALTGCANTGAAYQPILDGPQTAAYQNDLVECQALAREHSLINQNTKSDVLVGALIGGALGALDDGGVGNAIGGAAVGGAAGAASGAYDARDKRSQIVVNCLKGRGHRVVG